MPLSAEAVRFLFSGQAALPVTADFWGSLVIGHRMDAGALHDLVRELQDAGVLAGFGGEIDPAHGGFREAIVRSVPDRAVVRWSGGGLSSVCIPESVHAAAPWPSVKWLKIGAPFARGAAPQVGDVFAPETDRTLLVREEETRPSAPRTPEQDRVFAVATAPVLFDPPRSPWEQLADLAGTTPAAAREAVMHLVLQRRWRRFALRANAGAAGWRGSGLACWKVDSAHVERAAAALASVAATGDVCLRAPIDGFPFNVAALLPAFEEGSGERTAHGISRKWGIPLGAWLPMPDFSCCAPQRGSAPAR